jgi:putative oxygen-independent coproporphyrinogen III oxidase
MRGRNDFIPALLKEMESRIDYLGGAHVETIYFGGGTPSLLEEQEIRRILDRLRELFFVEPDAEITLEANPDDIVPSRPDVWRSVGINRLSIGVQSFYDEDLQWMNRTHDARQARDSIRLAQGAGIDNLSIDLIYGGSTLPDDHWRRNVDDAIALGVPHLSCYALTVEPRTALDKLIRRKAVPDVSPDDQARQFLLLMDWLGKAGYEHYEISNFALPGRRSRHNSSYWQSKPYLGLGPSAHSFNGFSRQWNVANNALYISGSTVAGKEDLTPVQQLNEYIMISLRTTEGSSHRAVVQRFGEQQAMALWQKAAPYMRSGKIGDSAEVLQLTQEGKLLADGIAADLFF